MLDLILIAELSAEVAPELIPDPTYTLVITELVIDGEEQETGVVRAGLSLDECEKAKKIVRDALPEGAAAEATCESEE